jgi:5-methylcytosine-specific restriction endonuclease McrA
MLTPAYAYSTTPPPSAAIPHPVRQAIYARDGYRCVWCGRDLLAAINERRPNTATLDHLIPRARGGWTTHTNLVTQRMHRFLANVPDDMEVDHWDGNGLNNRKRNLRIVTHQQNGCNRGPQANNTSGYKGVSWNKRDGKYEAWIRVNDRKIHLGYFDDILDAAKAYNEAAARLHQEFAKGNDLAPALMERGA